MMLNDFSYIFIYWVNLGFWKFLNLFNVLCNEISRFLLCLDTNFYFLFEIIGVASLIGVVPNFQTIISCSSTPTPIKLVTWWKKVTNFFFLDGTEFLFTLCSFWARDWCSRIKYGELRCLSGNIVSSTRYWCATFEMSQTNVRRHVWICIVCNVFRYNINIYLRIVWAFHKLGGPFLSFPFVVGCSGWKKVWNVFTTNLRDTPDKILLAGSLIVLNFCHLYQKGRILFGHWKNFTYTHESVINFTLTTVTVRA